MGPLSQEDKQRIKERVRKRYAKVAVTPEGTFRYPTGRAGLGGLKYDPQIINSLAPEVISSYCGVGNPFSLGPIHEGESVLDVGCGGGVDTLIAGMMVGPGGRAVGIDLIQEMVDRARENLGKTMLENVSFQVASPEELPFLDGSFDMVISNGAFNLIPEKAKALKEVFRVLNPDGRLMMADEILTGELPRDKEARIEKWARWEGGAVPGKDFLAMLERAGFVDGELVDHTGFDSSPVTKGVLLRAHKKEK